MLSDTARKLLLIMTHSSGHHRHMPTLQELETKSGRTPDFILGERGSYLYFRETTVSLKMEVIIQAINKKFTEAHSSQVISKRRVSLIIRRSTRIRHC
ncbi:hypothetical protein [Paenibacillus monticola]|uniref:Uncharacterized protein n=1 Tax=Paenibacillus monticola TaxID=2666075 RepID=A0A7X2H7E9_9BACL|nr:hypothetical protein [Paenibacillus monticola]MRN54886.1 hypothetical protein [Paenibacillus monticola]